jgi:adenosine deaminase
LCDEYIVVSKEFGYTLNDLVRFAENSFQASFAPNGLKAKYVKEVEDWANTNLTDAIQNAA